MIRVAIVEDDPVLCAMLAKAIGAAQGMVVSGTAANFAEGLEIITAGGHDVLLCDLGLPDGNGIDLIKAEAALMRGTDSMVITQFADPSKVLDSIRAGARGYLLKDQRVDSCIEAIRDIRQGGSPISPMIARQLLTQLAVETVPAEKVPEVAVISPLSEREHQVLNTLARGFSYAECAEILKLSENTIGFHVKNIYRKLEVNSRAEAVFEAKAQGILDQR